MTVKKKLSVDFAVEEISPLKIENDNSEEFAIAKLGFLSTRPNSHELYFSDEVFKRDIDSVLGKWVVAKMNYFGTDCTTHVPDESIMGIVPSNQEVELVEDEDGYIRAYVYAIISKIYAKKFYKIFEADNERAVSVEFTMHTENDNPTNDTIVDFNIVGITVLGKTVKPSCPQSDIQIVRFSEENAKVFFNEVCSSISPLTKFMKERKVLMEEKTYKVDKSQEAISDKAWGEVDKTKLRDKIMEASNRDALVKDVYMVVEEGWEDAPSEHLKYPVMELKGDTFVYNRDGLASALGYAKAEKDTAVVNKVEKIYKKLGLDKERKEEDTKMQEVEFSAVDIGDLWSKLYDALHVKYPDGDYGSVYRIDGIYEEDNKKFAVIYRRDEDTRYRLDFSLTEEGLTLADEIVKVELEIVETDEVRKFAMPEDCDKYCKFEEEHDDDCDDKDEDDEDHDDDDCEKAKMSCEEMEEKMNQLAKDIEDRDNIIMQYEAELNELREFKKTCMEADKTTKVNSVMEQVCKYMDKSTEEEWRKQGMKASFEQLSAWENSVKASIFDKAEKNHSSNSEFTRMSAPLSGDTRKSGSPMDRLKAQFGIDR